MSRTKYLFPLMIAFVIVAIASLSLASGPNTFRTFDARAVARAEAALWRDYYERRHIDLALGLMLNEHRLFGLSPWDSAQSGLNAASAARIFQRSRSRAEAQAALPALTRHFAIEAQANHAHFDPATAARLELEWWQLRRETSTGPDAYAPAIANATAYIYGLDPSRLADYARLRADAMALRDDRGAHITEADWMRITILLEHAYARLREKTTPTTGAG